MSTCPTQEQLERLLAAGSTADEDMRAHVLSCPKCRAWLEESEADTDLVGEIRRALADDEPSPDTISAGPEIAQRDWPSSIEGYQIIRELHRGGQGVVYQAVQQTTKRKVAIKVLLEGPYASKSAKRRFEREIELVAQLKHSNIISVFHSGTTADGRQYCVMDYIRGVPLTAYVRQNKPTLEEALQLFSKVCDAVNYAHQKGVIHRDLKPSNILVDVEGEPKVLDFGLAKPVSDSVQTLVSVTGQMVGTLPYASPEQTRGNPDEIDTRTDVYSLGVVLYEVLTGHYPYPVVGQMVDVLKHIAETPPTPPSRQWTADSGVTTRSAKSLRPGHCPVDDELQTIIFKTLAKERGRRYQSAGELAREIERYLVGEPIEAKRDSGLYVLKKALRRYRGPVTAVAAVFLALASGLFVATTQYFRAEDQRQIAEDLAEAERQARQESEKQRKSYVEVLARLDIDRLAEAKAAAGRLWPSYPAQAPAMEEWLLKQARPLCERLELHRKSLSSLHAHALTNDEDLLPVDMEDQRWHDKLARFVADLEAFADPDPKKGTVANVEARLAFANTIEARSIADPEVAAAWAEARTDIAALEVYHSLDLRAQIGLVPLRRDPRSGLWEFWHIQTGKRPQPNPDPAAVNPWLLTGETGLIFVLIPGGTFWMGAQKDDPEGINYDPRAKSVESPVHEVTLVSFFISKYEMTQGQWERFTGSNPSRYGPNWSWKGDPPADGPINQNTAWNPVEQVSGEDCREVMQRLGLVLPTEAQWEYAARAGTTTPWWCGMEEKSIATARAGNLSDGWSKNRGWPHTHYTEWLNDGWGAHAPVGSFSPNPFGLHNTIGNVREQCRDSLIWYGHKGAEADRDGLVIEGSDDHVYRGGSFLMPAANARSSIRISSARSHSSKGLRPARCITE